MTAIDPDRAYVVAGAFFAELAAHGLTDVVVSPGSRSTPLAISAHATVGVRTHVVLDERSAGFFALGLARATGRPVALVCTSGTAAANYLPAVVEAHYSRVPLIVCSADRPPELRDVGAGQTIDQVGLYGSHVRWAVDLPVASDIDAAFAVRVAARVIVEGGVPYPGPVHCNWPLREPLAPATWPPEPVAAPAPVVAIDRPVPVLAPETAREMADQVAAVERGVIVVGPGDLADIGDAVGRMAEATGWPVLAEATSSMRTGDHVVDRPFLSCWELLLRDQAWADDHRPDVVVRIGGAPTSKVLRLWLERHQPPLVVVDPAGRFDDPSSLITRTVAATPAAGVEALAGGGQGIGAWAGAWTEADTRLGGLVDRLIEQGPLLEVGVVQALDRALPAEAALVVSNSMPVRDVDGYLAASPRPLRVLANRGAAGIDGLTSLAFGVAASGTPTVLLTGDIALVHDIGGLHAGVRAGWDLTIVVPDNGGGGIFEFLPIAEQPGVDFEELFITPSRIEWEALAALGGVRLHQVTVAADLTAAVAASVVRSGIDVIRVPVDRSANVAQHRELAALVGKLA